MTTLVAGIDSSTQSCKVVIRNAETGALVRFGQAPHPEGTEVHPDAWWDALQAAIAAAGGLDDVAAASVGGQQHGMVVLDAAGEVIRPALLWNDTRSAGAATDLIAELGEQLHGDAAAGPGAWSGAIGSVLVASLTVTKLRWLADHEPENAAKVAAVALPHDWLTWKLAGATSLDQLTTDRSDASGTGYFDAVANEYRRDLLGMALRRDAEHIVLPRVLGPAEEAGRGDEAAGLGHLVLGPGAGDNAAAALGLGMADGDVALSLGTSGVVSAVSEQQIDDPSGTVNGFADATGRFLALAVTLNGSRVLDAAARLLAVDHAGLAELALAAEPGAGGLTHIPYLEGERTPNLPKATGSLLGMSLSSMTRENLARAAVEGLLCGQADGLAAVTGLGVPVESIQLIGGAARSRAVQQIAPAILGRAVQVPEPGEYVADGAARQAAWVLAGGDAPPQWSASKAKTVEAEATPEVHQRYAERRGLVAERG
ncbi:xylulokinase [Bogoriella caseilytica]|uniref:Xylulose kinase n=1 Tax=Bogoriella caseilytica TaxID=56055 RepID=A0A3N2BAV8_9MICO|nr:xylulokinase [Bogoriella caseilytica]ROR72395.1 xylulokinase [Bogoriella caseilytica]